MIKVGLLEIQMYRGSVFLVVLIACGPATPDPDVCDPTVDDCDTDTEVEETGDTAVTDGYLDVSTVSFSAQFGYDAESGEITAVTIEGSEIRPTIDVLLGWGGWAGDTNQTSQYCRVGIFLDGAPEADWNVGDDRIWKAYDAPGDEGATDCSDLDPEMFTDDVVAAFTQLDWGVAVGGMTDETRDWLEPQVDNIDEYVGGTFHVSDYLGEDVDMVYGLTYEVEADMAVIVDPQGNGTPIPAGQVELERLATGWYTLNSALYWTFTQN